jgi:hypothetical protein
MGWLSVVATGLAVRGSMRRKQRRADVLAQASELDRLRALTEDSEREYFIWPPEDDDER